MLYFCWMEINAELVDKLAMLSRLHFNDEEKAAVKDDLQKMIGFIDKLNGLDTTDVKPLLQIGNNLNVFREDMPLQNTCREDALLNAPLKDHLYFKVPKVIKK